MKAASNSGPLIHLARIGMLSLLRQLYGEILITPKVEDEVVHKGKQKGYPDALIVEHAIKEGWIRIVKVTPPQRFAALAAQAGLHFAEAEIIWLAHSRKITALLDDNPARKFARLLGVKVRGSIGVIITGAKRQLITKQKALQALDQLAETMYLDAKTYGIARKTLERL